MQFPNPFCPVCTRFVAARKPDCPAKCDRPLEMETRSGKEPIWRYHVKYAVHAVVRLDNLLVFSYGKIGYGGGLVALNMEDGKSAWSFSTPGSVGNALTTDGQAVYFGTLGYNGTGGQLYCLNREGKQVWVQTLEAGAATPPLVDEARVTIGLSNGQVLSYDANTGKLIFKSPVEIPDGKVWLIRPDEQMILALSETSGTIYALRPTGLGQFWPQPIQTNAKINSAPSLFDGKLYFGSEGGRLIQVDIRSKAVSWVRDGLTKVMGAPVTSEKAAKGHSPKPLWVGAWDHRLHAINPQNGHDLWKSNYLLHGINTSPAIEGGLAVVCVNEYGVYVFDTGLDAEDNEPLSDYHIHGAKLFTPPVLHKGLIYVGAGADQGEILALRWHMGKYLVAAKHYEAVGNMHEAGLYYAMAALEENDEEHKQALLKKAEACWKSNPAWAARMWEGLGEELKAAEVYCLAGNRLRGSDNKLAAEYYFAASRLFWRRKLYDREEKAFEEASILGEWPRINLKLRNNPDMVQGKPANLYLRAENIGKAQAAGIFFSLAGSIKEMATCEVKTPLEKDGWFDFSVPIIQTKISSLLEVEVEYGGSEQRSIPFTARLSVTLTATPEPTIIYMGDSVFGTINITSSTKRPVEIVMGDSVGTEVNFNPTGEEKPSKAPIPTSPPPAFPRSELSEELRMDEEFWESHGQSVVDEEQKPG